MDHPLVTVVTPSYNQGEFIRATIESVLSQNYPHVEYIIMDGGSTDQTADVVRDYSSRLTFISEKDRGQSHAINKGFQLARGSLLAWLNSDDTYLPEAIHHGVAGFDRNPRPGAVYGEGYLMDRQGNITSRFPCTEPPNIWKLVYISDYILQQTVFFRKDVLDEVGYLDETLHYTMDWDILIRIAKKYPLECITDYIGCLREYPEAKSFSGGKTRIRELHALLRRHTGRRLPPGSLIYGLDTYHRIWCDKVAAALDPVCKPVSRTLQRAIRLAAGIMTHRAIYRSQGLYADGWAAPLLRYMLPPSLGPVIIEGSFPKTHFGFPTMISVEANGTSIGTFIVSPGDFRLVCALPGALRDQLIHLEVRASQYIVEAPFSLTGGRRRIAYELKRISCAEVAKVQPCVQALSAP
jgi:hypothetical protein